MINLTEIAITIMMIMLGDKIYEKLDDGEVGEKVGQYKNNRASFFKKK